MILRNIENEVGRKVEDRLNFGFDAMSSVHKVSAKLEMDKGQTIHLLFQ
jgi:hypothetical protein